MHSVEHRLAASKSAIEHWFEDEWAGHPAPAYSSVDVRHAGFKIAPVDTNLFPGGWNNLTPEMWPTATQAFKNLLSRLSPNAQRLLIVPESHTRNLFYLSNVSVLQSLLEKSGLQVRVGSLSADIQGLTDIPLPNGLTLQLAPLIRQGDRVVIKDFDPCVVLLNTDLSAGEPSLLQHLKDQRLMPPLHAGWHVRRKHQHFQKYDEVCSRFSKSFDIDPWLLNPLFTHCTDIDFAEGTGLDALKSQVADLLAQIRIKYSTNGIDEKPFVIVKADNGTYGMGIMTVRDPSDLDQLNRKTRNKMSVVKDGQAVTEVLVQEGVPTRTRVQTATAEPVVYMVNGEVVGGFYRVNEGRGIDENLNAQGARFSALELTAQGDIPADWYAYSVIARLASLAASQEIASMAHGQLMSPDVFPMLDQWRQLYPSPPPAPLSCCTSQL